MGTAPNTQAPVSVVIPEFNGENHLHKMIESIQAQSHRTLEIIFTEGGGGDSSQEIITTLLLHRHLSHRRHGFLNLTSHVRILPGPSSLFPCWPGVSHLVSLDPKLSDLCRVVFNNLSEKSLPVWS